MVAKWFLPILMTVTFVLAGCTDRDLAAEADEREAFAKEHDSHDPIARLAGPQTIAPGALVWFNAEGSHDPDFLGATSQRDEARQEGGIHYQDDASSVSFSWYADLTMEGGSSTLGVGIREYRWNVDDGPTLVAPELTERYGTEDGPMKIPVGFTEPGAHTVQLTIVDWSGATDTVTARVDVAEGGAGTTADLEGFHVSEDGWTYTRNVDVAADEYGQCMFDRDGYDSVDDHVRVPWEVLFFAESLQVDATWDTPAAPEPADVLASPLHTTDLDMTLGHCANGDVFERFKTDQDPLGDGWEGGAVSLLAFSQKVEKGGHKTEHLAEWDHDLYTSDDGNFRGGTGTMATVAYTFVPATDTSGGGY